MNKKEIEINNGMNKVNDELAEAESVKADIWMAQYALILIRRCHFSLKIAVEFAESALDNLDGDTEDLTPDEAVSEEIFAMMADT